MIETASLTSKDLKESKKKRMKDKFKKKSWEIFKR